MRSQGLGSDNRVSRASYDRSRVLKHLAVHKVADTELQVVSDLESGVQAIVCLEKEVIERYTQDPEWQHGVITLFVLQDLEPLIRQLSRGVSASGRHPGARVSAHCERLRSQESLFLPDLYQPGGYEKGGILG